MSAVATGVLVRSLFRLGTPPQPFAVVEDTATGALEVVAISQEVFNFFVAAGIPVTQPQTVPPGSLVDVDVLCVFRIFIGAQNLISFAVGENVNTGEIVIVQIPASVFAFYRDLGVHLCTVPDVANEV